jgi:Immunity protein Imm1
MAESTGGNLSLEWGATERAEITSVEEMDALLDSLESEAAVEPFVVELVNSSGAALSMGLGRPSTVINYVNESLEPPYLQSVGSRDDDLVFRYRGEWTEYPPGSAVPTELGRRALREFFAVAEPPPLIEWQEV